MYEVKRFGFHTSFRCIKISLVHDMAESIVGDITPSDNVSKDDKHRMEREAMEKIMGLVGDEVGKELYSLWLVLSHFLLCMRL